MHLRRKWSGGDLGDPAAHVRGKGERGGVAVKGGFTGAAQSPLCAEQRPHGKIAAISNQVRSARPVR